MYIDRWINNQMAWNMFCSQQVYNIVQVLGKCLTTVIDFNSFRKLLKFVRGVHSSSEVEGKTKSLQGKNDGSKDS